MGRYSALIRGSEQSLDSRWGAWAREVSKALDGFLWITMGAIRLDPTTPPAQIAVGPTTGWVFTGAFNQYAYVELAIQTSLVDRSKPLVVGVGWAPAASEVGCTVKWQLDIGLELEGADIAAIDLTKTETAAVPPIAATYGRTGFTLTPAEWNTGADELHVRFSRAASGGVEPTLPGLHHIVLIQQLAL